MIQLPLYSRSCSVMLIDSRGAVPDYVVGLANALGAERCSVTVVGCPTVADGLDEEFVNAAPYFDLTFRGGRKNLKSYASGWLRTVRAIVELRPRIVHVQWFTRAVPELVALAVLRRFCRFRLVYTAHNVLPHEAEAYDRMVFSLVYRVVDTIVVHTSASRKTITSLFPRLDPARIVVVPHGVPDCGPVVSRSDARARLGLPESTTIIATIGKIRSYKGIETLLQAFAVLRDLLPVDLLVAGHPDDAEYAAQLKQNLDLLGGSRVHLRYGYLSNQEFTDAFAAADVIALPYLHIDQSGILAQALGHGRAVIASDLAGFREFVESEPEAVAFHAPGDMEDLARVVVEVAGNPERLASMSEHALSLGRRFSWPNVARVTIGRAYKEV